MKLPDINLSELKKAVEKIEGGDGRPRGFFTREEFCLRTGDKRDVACKKIGMLIDAGKLEVQFIRLRRRDGRIKSVPAYKLKGK